MFGLRPDNPVMFEMTIELNIFFIGWRSIQKDIGAGTQYYYGGFYYDFGNMSFIIIHRRLSQLPEYIT